MLANDSTGTVLNFECKYSCEGWFEFESFRNYNFYALKSNLSFNGLWVWKREKINIVEWNPNQGEENNQKIDKKIF